MNTQAVFSPKHEEPSRIAQWIVGTNDHGVVDYRNMLLPTLAWHTHHNQERWVTWVAAQFIERDTLIKYGVNLSTLRMIVDSHSNYSSLKLLLTALRNQRSSLVIASLPSISESEKQQLEQAAREGDCQCLLLIH